MNGHDIWVRKALLIIIRLLLNNTHSAVGLVAFETLKRADEDLLKKF